MYICSPYGKESNILAYEIAHFKILSLTPMLKFQTKISLLCAHSFCKRDEEPVEYLFWYCTVIRRCWDDICTGLWPYIVNVFELQKYYRGLQIRHKKTNKSSIHIIKKCIVLPKNVKIGI